jgi:two-component system alkaline phosphatase synthesis response regulator PhoP
MERNVTRILIIEPDPAVRAFLMRLLHRAGYDVAGVPDRAEGLALARRAAPQAILLDVSYASINGKAAIEPFKLERALAATPIILLSSRYDIDERRARALGYAGLITKPFHIHDLLELLAAHVAETGGAFRRA